MAHWLIVAITACWAIHFMLFVWVVFMIIDPKVVRIGFLPTWTFLLFIPFTLFWWSWVIYG